MSNENWESEGEWSDGEGDGEWDDLELMDQDDDTLIQRAEVKQEDHALKIDKERKCQNEKCGAPYYNTFICPECGTIDQDLYAYELQNKKYSEVQELIKNIVGENDVNTSIDKIYEIEINLYVKNEIQLIDTTDNVCQCCFMDFDIDCPRVIGSCHSQFCEECVKQWIAIKVRDDEVKPYIKCLAEGCHNPLSMEVIKKYMKDEAKHRFIKYFSFKTLLKYTFFKQCKTHDCMYGCVFNPNRPSRDGVQREVTKKKVCCIDCKKDYEYEYKDALYDKEIQDMIKSGMIRLCPSCGVPSTKDRKSCNVITCVNCKIYWNWESKKTGPNYGSVTDGKHHFSNDAYDEKTKKNYFEDKIAFKY